ncbi:MAG: tetratricopeptide repeat protein [Bacteroidales bacterium]|nr:tetratricopeptide repeat protein [Bacteroidales bacterium]
MKKLLLYILLATSLAAIAAKDDAWTRGEQARHADFLFMEAMRQNALENHDAYFELLNRAYALDTTQTAVGHDLGYLKMMIAENDTNFFKDGYRLMAKHFAAHPEDYYSSMFYGQINDRLRNSKEAIRVWSTLDSLFPDKIDVTVKLAEALGASGDPDNIRRSVDVYNRVEVAEGKDVGITSRKIRSLYSLGDTAAIKKELRSLLAASPRSAEFNIYAGDLSMALSEPDTALMYYNRACELDSTNGMAFFQRANLYRELGDSVAFDREVFTALRQDNLDLDAKLQMFKGYIQELYSDSLQQPRINSLFNVLLEQNPHEVDVRDLYTAYLIAIDDFAGAAEQTSYALDIDPSSEERWRALASLYFQADDVPNAIQAGKKALHYHPDNAQLWLITGSGYSMVDSIDQALEYYGRALELVDSTNYNLKAQIMASTADAYYKQNNVEKAIELYEQVVQIDPGNLLALNNYAYYLACEGRDLDKAEQMSAITVRDNPQNSTALDTYAWVFFKKGDYAMARQYIDAAIANMDPEEDNAEIYHHAGDIYFMDGKPDEALEFWRKALKLDPNDELLQRKVSHKTFFYK